MVYFEKERSEKLHNIICYFEELIRVMCQTTCGHFWNIVSHNRFAISMIKLSEVYITSDENDSALLILVDQIEKHLFRFPVEALSRWLPSLRDYLHSTHYHCHVAVRMLLHFLIQPFPLSFSQSVVSLLVEVETNIQEHHVYLHSIFINDVVLKYSCLFFHSPFRILRFPNEIQEYVSRDKLPFESLIPIVSAIVMIIPYSYHLSSFHHFLVIWKCVTAS